MKTLMSATALTALVFAMPASAQSVDSTMNPLLDNPAAQSETGGENNPMSLEPSEPRSVGPDAMPGITQAPAELPTVTSTVTDPMGPTGTLPGSAMFVTQQAPGNILASSLVGASVENPTNEELGDINDVVLTADGRVDAVVIGVGGFLGIGEKDVAVSYSAIERMTDANGNVALVLNASEEDLEAAPQYVTVSGLPQDEDVKRQAYADPLMPSPERAQ